MKLPWTKRKSEPKKVSRKKRKPQAIFGRLLHDGFWFEQRRGGVFVRQKYGRKWQCVGFNVIRDYAIGQYQFPM